MHLVEKMQLSQLAQQVLVVFLESTGGRLLINDITHAYQQVWHQQLLPMEYGHSRLLTLMKNLHYILKVRYPIQIFQLKALDTIGNCQRLVFTVGVSQHVLKTTNR